MRNTRSVTATREYSEYVSYVCRQRGGSPFGLFVMREAESAFDPDAESGVGAKGLMQMTDDTFVWMQSVLGEEGEYETSLPSLIRRSA